MAWRGRGGGEELAELAQRCSPVGCMVGVLVSTLQSHRMCCDALGAWPGHRGGSPRPGVCGLWCVPLPTPRAHSFDLPGDTVLSLWLGNGTRCPLGASGIVLSMAKAQR